VLIHGDAASPDKASSPKPSTWPISSVIPWRNDPHHRQQPHRFTTAPGDEHSSRFASDLAKRQPVPIFHVNAEDVDAVVRVARIAAEYRYQFHGDVVVDLIGFRRTATAKSTIPPFTPAPTLQAHQGPPAAVEIDPHGFDVGARRHFVDASGSIFQQRLWSFDEPVESGWVMVDRRLLVAVAAEAIKSTTTSP